MKKYDQILRSNVDGKSYDEFQNKKRGGSTSKTVKYKKTTNMLQILIKHL